MINKRYKKGYCDASQAYAQFGRKQERAIKEVGEKLHKSNEALSEALNDVKAVNDEIFDYLSYQEKAALYSIHTPCTVRELSEEGRHFVVGCLYKLSEAFTPTNNQQCYLRAIMHYLSVEELPLDINLKAINTFSDIEDQKAIFQIIIEYLSLQNGEFYDESTLQNEFISEFHLNEATKASIIESNESFLRAVGFRGLAEKYEFGAKHHDIVDKNIDAQEYIPSIPYFKKPITIIYEEQDELASQMAEYILARIHEKLDAMGVTYEAGKCTNIDYKVHGGSYEKEGHLIFLGIPKEAKPISKIINWEYDELGMQYGTKGTKSIINAIKLKDKEITSFVNLVKNETKQLAELKIPDGIESGKLTFLKDIYESMEGEGAIGVLAGIVLSPLIAVGTGLDLLQFGLQRTSNILNKEELRKLQYMIAIEKFLNTRIEPYIKEKGTD